MAFSVPDDAGSSKPETCAPITVERVEIEADRVSVLARWHDGTPRRSNESIAAAVKAAYPDVAAHRCVNERGPRFGDVLESTPLPHVLEHLIISETVADPAVPRQASIAGTSEWADEPHGLARIEVSLVDDLVALRALRSATAFLNHLLTNASHN